MCAFFDIKLNTSRMKIGNVVLGSTATLNKVKVRLIINNDKSMLKLTRACSIKSEIGLKRDLYRNARRNINK